MPNYAYLAARANIFKYFLYGDLSGLYGHKRNTGVLLYIAICAGVIAYVRTLHDHRKWSICGIRNLLPDPYFQAPVVVGFRRVGHHVGPFSEFLNHQLTKP
jgi:hypothetical protein